MIRFNFLIVLLVATANILMAVDPTATDYTFIECQGSAIPYPDRNVKNLAYPDSLTPIYINHIGRHGSRYLSSPKSTKSLLSTMLKADSIGTITPMGRELMTICKFIDSQTAGRWGALDSLGMAEQRAIASRTFTAFPSLFNGTKISAISSYSPRCVMSMNEFTHQLTRLNNNIEIYASSGRQNSSLLRAWQEDESYKAFIAGNEWRNIYDDFFEKQVPTGIAERAVGKSYPFDEGEAKEISMNIFKILTGCSAMSIQLDLQKYFTKDEINALWSVENLNNYLRYSATTLSEAAPELAVKLLSELISTSESAVNGENPYSVMLRFGHAETIIPLLALIHIPGCYYMTNYFDTVGLHWRNFHSSPMSANLQMIVFRTENGKHYLRVDLNEIPMPLIPGRNTIYIPWETAREYLNRCLPMYMQI